MMGKAREERDIPLSSPTCAQERLEMIQLYATLLGPSHRLHPLVQRRVYIVHVIQRVVYHASQQIVCEVRHVIMREVPAMQDTRRDHRHLVAMATRAEELAEVLAVAIAPHVACNGEAARKETHTFSLNHALCDCGKL